LTISAQAIDNIQEAEWFLSIPKIVRPNIEGLSDKRIFLSEETLGRLVSREAVVKSVKGTSRILSFAGLYASVWWNEGALYRGLTSTLNEIDALNNVSGLAAKSVAELFSKNGTYGSPIFRDLILSGTSPKDILVRNGVPSVVAAPLSSLVFKDGLVLPIFGSPQVPVLKGNRHSFIGRLGASYSIKGYDKIDHERFRIYGDFWAECLLSRESSRHFRNKQAPKLVGIKYNLNVGFSIAFWTAK